MFHFLSHSVYPYLHGCHDVHILMQVYDLALPGLWRNNDAGCLPFEGSCKGNEIEPLCGPHGVCEGSRYDTHCECKPGWTGPRCDTSTTPVMFHPESCVKYALSFPPNAFVTEIQLRFRTREPHGEMFRAADQHNREFVVLEVSQEVIISGIVQHINSLFVKEELAS